MPLHRYNVRARRIKLFTRTKQSPSLNTFINNNNTTNDDINNVSSINSDLSSSIVKSGNMLRSKSTYFYHGGNSSRKGVKASAQSFQRHPVSLSKSNPLRGRDFDPAQPGNDALWKNRTSAKFPHFSYLVPSVCGLAFLVGLGAAINPTINAAIQVSATDNGEIMTTAAGDPNISLTVNGNAEMKNDTAKPGDVAYVDNTFSVSVKDSWYAVLVRAANGYTSDLINQQNTNAKVTGVGVNVPESNFKENTWGYALTTIASTEQSSSVDNKTLSYNTVPESNDFTPAYSNTVSGEQTQNFKVSFAAKFGNDAPSGHYQTKVYLSAVSDPTQVSQIYEFTANTMQELTAVECTRAAENTTKQLKDERDGKYYWATKLRDGNCWMTQNMDYDGGGTLKAISAWPSSYNSSDNKFYNNPGDYVYTYSGHGQKASDYCEGVQSFDSGTNCTNLYTEVTSSNQSTLDMHYHVGNFYTYDAAINGVCPSGWQLPTRSSTADDGSFGALMNAYSISGSTNLNKLYSDTYPLRFVYGGYLHSGNLLNAGYNGRYWSSTPNDSDYAFYFGFVTSVNPSDNHGRCLGMSVRCLLKTDK